ncbi:recombinase family protein [Mucilaginibacter flavus]|uniref:recombinase family protein n=1 Tax=Mucilaginibacter flavus TaxID=931504 RepID=UPI0025B59718|nr:recombinase family protein [Mucilaginibacter flavus]MDN3580365.1 recombinase family protein [Mucilaginibacter flavus]
MRIKYNRVSTQIQTGNRFTADTEKYDSVFLDKISGSVAFKDRPKGKELTKLVEAGKVEEIVIEEFSRIGRNTGDVINVLLWLEEKKVNVIVRNLGLQSRPNGERNPIWNMISSVMSSLYQMELENIKERTSVGRLVYVQNGGKLGRPAGTSENDKSFLEKSASQQIIKGLRKGLTVREIAKVAEVSTKTVMKVKALVAPL